VVTCQYPEKRFGVCGVHKKFVFQDDGSNPEFSRQLVLLKNQVEAVHEEAQRLEEAGYDTLQAQSLMSANLQTLLPGHTNSVFSELVRRMELAKTTLKNLQSQFPSLAQLIYNLFIRANHQNSLCSCAYCSLRVVPR